MSCESRVPLFQIKADLDLLGGPVDEDVERPHDARDGDDVERDAAEQLPPLQRRHVQLLPLAKRLHLKQDWKVTKLLRKFTVVERQSLKLAKSTMLFRKLRRPLDLKRLALHSRGFPYEPHDKVLKLFPLPFFKLWA